MKADVYDMALGLTSGKVTEELLAWLESDEHVGQNPDMVRLKFNLMEKLAARKRRMSSVSESNTSSCFDHLRKLVASASDNLLNNSSDVDNVKNQASMVRYKTELCRSFSENGYCRYGDKCQFAHGMVELRQTARHPRYKTEFCKAYHMNGFCPYGARCNFIHNDVELQSLTDGTQCVLQDIDNCMPMSTVMNRTLLHFSRNSSSGMFWPSRLVLGSTLDSPPQSITDSPSPSPTAMLFEPAFDSLQSLWESAVSQK